MPDFYHQVLRTCEPYFAERTKRFIDRQIVHHLSKTPEILEYSDKEELAYWIRISTALVLGPDKASELAEKVVSLPKS